MENYKARRAKLFEQVQSGIVVLLSAPEYKRNHDTGYKYRQNSNFYYYTGFREAHSIAVFMPESDKPYRLFLSPKDPHKELWEGKLVGVEKAPKLLGCDEAYPIADFEKMFTEWATKAGTVWTLFGENKEQASWLNNLIVNLPVNIRKSQYPLDAICNVRSHVYRQRMVKDASEIELMRLNCRNSALAHAELMRQTRPGMNESELQAAIEFEFARRGANEVAYTSIVAAGNNANILHYIENNSEAKDGDLLLVDAGGERDLYASDITRTFPVNGKFTDAQRDIYEIVLKSQKDACAIVRPGIEYAEIHRTATKVLIEGMLDLGLLQGSVEENLASKAYTKFYPHTTGHYIGIDVHDVGIYEGRDGRSSVLEAGNVFTIEPGLYFDEKNQEIPEKYRGIGIRIEDDILVTSKGYENLTDECPKEISEIESLMASAR